MKKDIFATAILSSLLATSLTLLSIFTVFASGPGEPFPDVDENAYYSDSTLWVRNMGLIEGYDNGDFGPDDPVTRGQLAVILERYDDALVNPPYPYVSGVYDLMQLLCFGGLEYNIESEGIQAAYDDVCDMP
jgi:hypothetical protein